MSLEELQNTLVRTFYRSARQADIMLYKATGTSLFFGGLNGGANQPARVFEERYDVKNIAGNYNFPENINAWSLERDMAYRTDATDGELEILEELLVLNPALKSLEFDKSNPNQISNILWGITSGFNVEDIQYFLDTDDNKHDRFVEVSAYSEGLNLFIDWIASPSTLQKIALQCGKDENWRPSEKDYHLAEQRWSRATGAIQPKENSPEAI